MEQGSKGLKSAYPPETRVEGIYKSYGVRFGFLLTDALHEDIYIAEKDRRTAMNNDRVEVVTFSSCNGLHRTEGRVTRILERANETVVGTFELTEEGGRVTPIDEKIGVLIDVPRGQSQEARSGARVIVRITQWPERQQNARGRVAEIIGYEGDKGLDITVIIAQHKLPHVFPEGVINEAEHLPQEVREEDRTADFRNLPLVTIDGADAKDLDDAVFCQKKENGHYQLGVHIADVSRYVKKETELDQEAYKRGTSVYLADRVIPMLPFQLSNGICSLNEGEDRYAMSCVMDVAQDGTVTVEKLTPSLIHVGRRCNYAEVNKGFHEGIVPEDLRDFMPMLNTLRECASVLRQSRARRGAIDFDFPEYKVILDDMGQPVRIEKRVRDEAEKMIEDAMIAANEAVARFLRDTGHTAVYRVHGGPDAEKLDSLRKLTEILGLPIHLTKDPAPGDIQKFLASAKDTQAYPVIEIMTLRALPQACYSTENIGHFGIASSCYTHFTSPIRRYPDLMVHRLIRQALYGHPGDKMLDRQKEFLERASAHCSVREQASVDAERDTVDLKMTEYMVPYVGEVFEAHITGVTRFGIFVGLDNGAEGLVHVDSMDDDNYVYDEDTLSLRGQYGGQRYMLGMPVTVTLIKADKDKKEIDFVLGEITSPLDLEKRIRNITQRSRKKMEKNQGKKGTESRSHRRTSGKSGRGKKR